MPPTLPAPPDMPQLRSFDDALGRRIVQLHVWAVREGLRGATAYELFDGYCQRLVDGGVALWRGFAATRTLHPQWRGYGYTWRRDLNAIQPSQFGHGEENEPDWLTSPFKELVRRAEAGERNPMLRRRLAAGPDQRDFPVLEAFFAAGATDHYSQLFTFGERGAAADPR